MMKAVVEWLVIGLGVGTATAMIRYLAVWYLMRRMRRVMSWRRRHNKEPQT